MWKKIWTIDVTKDSIAVVLKITRPKLPELPKTKFIEKK